MSLDFSLVADTGGPSDDWPEVYSCNITHNLGPMWTAAGCYNALYESGGKWASEIIGTLDDAVVAMKADPAKFEALNSPNGWGLYKHALPWLADVLAACRKYPRTFIRVSR